NRACDSSTVSVVIQVVFAFAVRSKAHASGHTHDVRVRWIDAAVDDCNSNTPASEIKEWRVRRHHIPREIPGYASLPACRGSQMTSSIAAGCPRASARWKRCVPRVQLSYAQHQFLGRSGLHNSAAFQYDHLICDLDQRHTMRDDNCGSIS